MNIIGKIGNQTLVRWWAARRVVAVMCGVLWAAMMPRHWPRTVRELFVRQILFTGVYALGLITLVAILAGISIVTQVQVWLSRFGQSEMLGSVLVAIIIREIGPLLVNFIVIGRSGTAITTELANMRVRRETNVLDAQGIDLMTYLIMPRVIGIVVSVLCLSVFFSVLSLASGYFAGLCLNVAGGQSQQFIEKVAGAISGKDIANFLAKTLIPGLSTGTICCIEGLSIQGAVTEVPQAAARGVVKSIAAVLVLSAIVSILTYS